MQKIYASLGFPPIAINNAIEYLLGKFVNRSRRRKADDEHLSAAVQWLESSIDATGGNGSSMAFRFLKGWMPPYPETTGYIIRTLIDLSHAQQNDKYLEIARGCGDWLLGIQMLNGGFVGRYLGATNKPIVFNTGQILLGLNGLYHVTKSKKYLDAAKRAGDFLISCMDDDGCFVRNQHSDIIHAYDSRVGWALIELGIMSRDDKYKTHGIRNLDWTLMQQQDNGYFANNTFYPGQIALTHTIGYVMSGILETYRLLGGQQYLDAVVRAAEPLVKLYGITGKLSAHIDDKWRNASYHICATGYPQIAEVMLRLYELTTDMRYYNLALHLIDDVCAMQNLSNPDSPYYGAIPGSFPIFGKYAPLQYPNWATKFFIDSLLVKKQVAIKLPVMLKAA